MEDSFRHKGLRKKLIGEIRSKGIRDESVLEAMGAVPRHLFMDNSFVSFAYVDKAFPISSGQTISQPYTVAFQTEALQIRRLDKVLEVGTGSGYQAAVLCQMGVTLYTIERQRSLFDFARTLLPKLGYHPQFFYGDGYLGLPTYGPFDKIIVTAGADSVPEKLKEQLAVGGRMVIPVGGREHQVMKIIVRKSETEYDEMDAGYFVFVPLLPGVSDQNR
ncbi:MAG TPA: protein-L-isoaspartate(D-aspartate) O-methyltransferase [Prolixibacteraceae bacterium]|nr:protein-L-isoaspartate(D-aspartate) O-methyltransferase [Prolixibacteraceae bacterium]